MIRGAGSHGLRSARVGGGAVVASARKVVEEGRPLAARMLEAAAADVTYAAGRFTVAGTDRGVGLFEVAAFAEKTNGRLAAEADFATAGDVHANGWHACEVTVDTDDGTVRLERHAIVADVGRAINPLIVHGQMHERRPQGVGQALMEHVVFEADSGQPVSASFMDYAIPRADDLPFFAVELNEVAEPRQPARREGGGGERHDRRSRGGDERPARCPAVGRRRRRRHAGHPRAGLAGAPPGPRGGRRP